MDALSEGLDESCRAWTRDEVAVRNPCNKRWRGSGPDQPAMQGRCQPLWLISDIAMYHGSCML